ncbi:hypothetical protein CAOG_08539 [Capsaspora owczarzaki ATCC 30864]|uniref:Phosphatidate cytidylyltransferase n=1 Tax=Capsaspora owczarzaki (strain ATCC 30864) TaxID=595528 RepID=A0A0D2WJR6_CAPO3|nr:hypothetical protein CAOG_08539 [Capsaspora owczarzaki ATCC 30864]KJE90370.1 hypothetical protein CAOG_008539 [Capsaspora owczarzaki ATCC 30864]|eukprot:XP_011270120.1 hypothetical protein CAOG_08539 [Capsaspora owczarzaki ATCC 30864]
MSSGGQNAVRQRHSQGKKPGQDGNGHSTTSSPNGGNHSTAAAQSTGSAGAGAGAPAGAEGAVAEAQPQSRWINWAIRGIFTWIMIFAFCGIVQLGHFALTVLVMIIQILSFKEIVAINYVPYKEKKLPWFRVLNWFFLFATNYYLYGGTLFKQYYEVVDASPILHSMARHHELISFSLYMLGFVSFVATLKKGHYKFQFGQFGFTHIILVLIVTQSNLVMLNIFEGLVWLILPASLVVCNDVMAYMFGFFFGRTRLTQLSPKKTWEGFIGALFSTYIFGFVLSYYLAQYDFFTCPFTGPCEQRPYFTLQNYTIPLDLVGLTPFTVAVYPVQLHSLSMSTFASIVAPFGGFFASGFKRAFKIKDFADLIPGHGGITDRFDCQFLMATFAYVYLSSFVHIHPQDPARILSSIAALDIATQVDLFNTLKQRLAAARAI